MRHELYCLAAVFPVCISNRTAFVLPRPFLARLYVNCCGGGSCTQEAHARQPPGTITRHAACPPTPPPSPSLPNKLEVRILLSPHSVPLLRLPVFVFFFFLCSSSLVGLRTRGVYGLGHLVRDFRLLLPMAPSPARVGQHRCIVARLNKNKNKNSTYIMQKKIKKNHSRHSPLRQTSGRNSHSGILVLARAEAKTKPSWVVARNAGPFGRVGRRKQKFQCAPERGCSKRTAND